MGMIDDGTIDCWRKNYGLDKRSPEDAARWWAAHWSDMAPAGAVAALGLALQELDELRDCRTCRHFRGTQHCHSVLKCVDGSSYQRGGVVQLWEAAPIEPAPF